MNKDTENKINIPFLKGYIEQRGLSTNITNHPRYDSILWKLSLLMIKSGVQACTPQASNLLAQSVIIKKDGSIVIIETNRYGKPAGTKYYYDKEEHCFKRMMVYSDYTGSEYVQYSTFNDDGIETELITEQKLPGNRLYRSRTTRVPERIDMIKIESEDSFDEENAEKYYFEGYQKRVCIAALEDIDPTIEDLDPLNVQHLSILGVPPIYRDLESGEIEIIEQCDGEIFPLDEESKQELLKKNKDNNKLFGRTRRFEKGVEKYLFPNIDLDYAEEH